MQRSVGGRSGARCSSTSSARLLQGRGLPPSLADGVGGWRSRGTDQGCGGSDCVARGGHVGPDGTVRGLTPSARRVTFAEASPGRQARGRRSGDRDSAIVVMPRRVFGRSGESAEVRGLTPPALPRPPTTWGISICPRGRETSADSRRGPMVRLQAERIGRGDGRPAESETGPASIVRRLPNARFPRMWNGDHCLWSPLITIAAGAMLLP